jgi:hypothetical protein
MSKVDSGGMSSSRGVGLHPTLEEGKKLLFNQVVRSPNCSASEQLCIPEQLKHFRLESAKIVCMKYYSAAKRQSEYENKNRLPAPPFAQPEKLRKGEW